MTEVRPADRLRALWAAGDRPELEAFVAAAGPLDSREIAAVLRADQAERWAAGTPVVAEEYLRRFPVAAADPEAALDLIHNEFLLRERHDTAPDPDEFVRRFPDHADTLRMQIDLHRVLGPEPTRTRPTPHDPADRALGLPEEFGRYRIEGTLGRGGMGTVYAAYDTKLDRKVALKVPSFMPGDGDAVERFVREARIAAGLSHPNLCPVYDVGELNGLRYLTMPVVQGDALAARLKRNGRLSPAEAVRLVATVARAVGVAHAAGVVHRDLKPANILLDAKNNPIVTDFGLARRGSPGENRMTASGLFIGTPGYAAPEQIAAVDAATPAADVYALGTVLYECLTGQLPFDGPPQEMLRRKLIDAAPRPSRLVHDLDPNLDAICMKALARSPDGRYQSCDELADALESVSFESPALSNGRGRWRPLRVSTAISLAVLLLFGLFVGLGSCKSRSTGTSRPEADPVMRASDWLPAGSRWSGEYSFRPEVKEAWHEASLHVTERDGETFRGVAETRDEVGDYAWEVTGWVRGDRIRWSYVKVIREARSTGSVDGGAYAEGSLTDNRLDVTYHDHNSSAPMRFRRQN